MIKCKFCGSENTIVNKRGFNIITGFIGSSKLMVTCLKCGCKEPLKPENDDFKTAKQEKNMKNLIKFAMYVILLSCLIIMFRVAGLL